MPGLPRWAEKYFSLKCSEAGAICTRPDEDHHGWDFLVEFPEQKHSGAADGWPPIQKAFVQVKSTRGTKRRASIKLSNVLKACRSDDPWFIILITKKDSTTSLYGIHVWTDFIRRGLEKVRRLSIEGIPLHKREMTIAFPSESQINENIIAWMQKQIDEAAPRNYAVEKGKLSDFVGYEDGYGIGHLTVEAESQEEIVRAFLGLGPGIKAKHFSFTPARFGIPDPREAHDFLDGRIQITPNPVAPCEMKLRGPHDQPSLTLQGSVYSLRLPGTEKTYEYLRFSASPIELIFSFNGTCKTQIDLDKSTSYNLSILDKYAKILSWLNLGPIEVAVWSQGKPFLNGSMNLRKNTGSKINLGLSLITEALMKAAGENAPTITLSLNEINSALPDLSIFYQTLQERPLIIEFDTAGIDPAEITSVLYYSSIQVGKWGIACIIKRQSTKDVVIGDKRRIITASQPIILEHYICDGNTELLSERIQEDYRRIQKLFGSKENILSIGNVIDFISGKKDVSDPVNSPRQN